VDEKQRAWRAGLSTEETVDRVVDAAEGVVDGVVAAAEGVVDRVVDAAEGVVDRVVDAAEGVVDGVVDATRPGQGDVGDTDWRRPRRASAGGTST
jgi:Glu-tRNA(Gln) amidotransferase subunit E-like FAD-binding protein